MVTINEQIAKIKYTNFGDKNETNTISNHVVPTKIIIMAKNQ